MVRWQRHYSNGHKSRIHLNNSRRRVECSWGYFFLICLKTYHQIKQKLLRTVKFEFCSVTFLLRKYKINTADFPPSESRDPNFINMPKFLNQEINWCLVMKKSSFMFRLLRYAILILIYYDFQIQFLPRPFSAGSLLSSAFTLKLFVKRQINRHIT